MSTSHVPIRLQGMCFIKTLMGKSHWRTVCSELGVSVSLNLWWHSQHRTKKNKKQPICKTTHLSGRRYRLSISKAFAGGCLRCSVTLSHYKQWEAAICSLRSYSVPAAPLDPWRKKTTKKKNPVVHSLPGSFHPVCSSSVANDIGFSHRGIWEATQSQALFCHGEGMEGILFPSASPRMHYTEVRGPCWHPSILIVPHL